jgi:hypothetical protein
MPAIPLAMPQSKSRPKRFMSIFQPAIETQLYYKRDPSKPGFDLQMLWT